jgi:hypothetical protein
VADLGTGPVAIVGQRLDQQRDSTRPVSLVHHRLERRGVVPAAGALGDCAIDVVLRHPCVLRLLDRVGQRRVARRVTAAVAGGDLDRAAQLREQLPALGVDRLLLVLDLGPFRVAGHAGSLGRGLA